MCEWKRLTDELPPKLDKWYLFGGYDSNGDFVFNNYHFSTHGLINGWKVEAQQISLHESWSSLQRYTNLKPEDIDV